MNLIPTGIGHIVGENTVVPNVSYAIFVYLDFDLCLSNVRRRWREGYIGHFGCEKINPSTLTRGRTGGSGPPTPGVQPPYPRPIFSYLPRPLFLYFFFGYPRPKFRFLHTPRSSHPRPRPFFVKNSPTPRAPVSLSCPTLTTPVLVDWIDNKPLTGR